MRLLLVTTSAWMLVCGLPLGAADRERFLVRSWQSEDGLPSNNIRAVVQATDGYLWIATAEGVVRFDGVRFDAFQGVPGVWHARKPPRALFALEDGEVWIATTRGGVLRWDGRQIAEVWEEPPEESGSVRVVTQVTGDGAGGILIECSEGLHHWTGSGPPRKLDTRSADSFNKTETRLMPWQRGIATAPGVPLQLVDQAGRTWMRTPNGGLAVLRPGAAGEPEVLPQFLEGAPVVSLTEDREHNLWAGTNGRGLHQVRAARVNVLDAVDGLPDPRMLTVLEDRSGALWAATKSGAIHRILDGRAMRFPLGVRDADRNVAAVCLETTGTLWAGKTNGALFKLEGDAFQPVNGETPVVRRLQAMVPDTEGRLWLGGADGLAVWADGTTKSFGPEHGLARQPVSALAVAADQSLWVGMADGTVYRGKENRFVKVGTLGSEAVSMLLPADDGTLWAATLGAGLFLVKDGRITRFAEPQGLPEPRLTCVLDDGAGHLWLGSLAGILRVPKAALFSVVDGKTTGASWLHLDRADGLLSRECSGGVQPAGWRGRDGTLWFPTLQGMASIDPRRFETNRVPPLVQIEEGRERGHQVVPAGAVLEAGPGRSRLEFRFTALSFTAPEKVRFRTRLEGLEDEWQDAGHQRTVAYEAVPPGEYTFRVMAANNDGVWSERSASLAVQVLPHFWETLGFRVAAGLLVVMIAGGIGVLIARARARGRLLRLEAETARLVERERIAQDLHDDLGASLTEISLIAGLAEEEAHGEQRRDTIPVIAARARQLVSTLDEIVWAVNPRHDTLDSFAEYLTASAAELLDTAGIALRLGIAEELPKLHFDAEQRHALFLAVREALNNAVKHSAATEVKLGVQMLSGVLIVTIRDNGRGFAPGGAEPGEGLRNMRARLAGLGGSCQIGSDATGTTVTFSLPLSVK